MYSALIIWDVTAGGAAIHAARANAIPYLLFGNISPLHRFRPALLAALVALLGRQPTTKKQNDDRYAFVLDCPRWFSFMMANGDRVCIVCAGLLQHRSRNEGRWRFSSHFDAVDHQAAFVAKGKDAGLLVLLVGFFWFSLCSLICFLSLTALDF